MKKMIEQYILEHFQDYTCMYYEDDGYTGMNYNRPGFSKLLQDAFAEKILKENSKNLLTSERKCAIIKAQQKHKPTRAERKRYFTMAMNSHTAYEIFVMKESIEICSRENSNTQNCQE